MSSYLTYSPIITDIFPENYGSARRCLIEQVFAIPHGLYLKFECPGETPNGEPLYTDTVWIGPEKARNVLVLLAGTHGVEGFAGSAIEIDHLSLMAAEQLVIPADTAVLIVHALTPWGYAWLRRCDESGVDLNRNLVDFTKPLPKNTGYDLLRSALFLSDNNLRKTAFIDFERQYGRTQLEIAISGGQYYDPAGSFYGGKKPAHGRLVSEDLIRQYHLVERNLAVIDLHTGLGPYGYGEIICDHDPRTAGAQVAYDWYGDSVTLPALGTSSSVPKTGLMDYLWHATMNDRSCHITLEFGTYPTDQLFEILLRDHQLWAQPDNRPARLEHSKLMRQHFCPNDDAWKIMVLFRARQVIAQALQGLSGNVDP